MNRMMKTLIHLIRHALYVVQFISRRMEKIRTDIRDISVLTATNLLMIELIPYFTGLTSLWTQWIHFIELELYKMPLEGEAQVLGTSKITCFYMRHKLYHAASEIMGHQKLSGEVEIDTQYKSINLKGTRPQNMPRYSRKEANRLHIEGYLIIKLPLYVLQMKMII